MQIQALSVVSGVTSKGRRARTRQLGLAASSTPRGWAQTQEGQDRGPSLALLLPQGP